MNLFRNTYNDLEEIREWIKNEPNMSELFEARFPDTEVDNIDLEKIREWFEENEEIASEYRQFHYGKQWNVSQQ